MGSHFGKTTFIVLPGPVPHPVAVEHGGVRVHALQLAVQRVLPRPVHRRQPDAAAGDLPAAVPDLQAGAVARLPERHRHRQPARHEDRGDPHPRRVPDRVLHVRAVELHEDDPEGAVARPPWSTAPRVPRQFFQVILPLTPAGTRRAGTLEFTWLYNDFFWGAVLLQPGSRAADHVVDRGAQRPVRARTTTSIAAASIMIALPTLVVYLALQKHFISGLTLGATRADVLVDRRPRRGPAWCSTRRAAGAGSRCTGAHRSATHRSTPRRPRWRRWPPSAGLDSRRADRRSSPSTARGFRDGPGSAGGAVDGSAWAPRFTEATTKTSDTGVVGSRVVDAAAALELTTDVRAPPGRLAPSRAGAHEHRRRRLLARRPRDHARRCRRTPPSC